MILAVTPDSRIAMEWLVRFQVSGWSVERIAAEAGIADTSDIAETIKLSAKLIDLPLREEPK